MPDISRRAFGRLAASAVGVTLAGEALLACGSSNGQAKSRTRSTSGGQSSAPKSKSTALTITVGGNSTSASGIMLPAFKKAAEVEGVNVVIKNVPQSTAILDLPKGGIDLAFLTWDAIGNAQLQGTPLIAIAPAWKDQTALLVAADSDYNSIASLRGKAVGAFPRNQGAFVGPYLVFEDQGFNMDKQVKVQTVEGSALMLGLFLKGKLAAIEQVEPSVTRLLFEKKARQLFQGASYWEKKTGKPAAPVDSWTARKDWTKKVDMDLVRHIASRAYELVHDNRSYYDSIADAIGMKSSGETDLIYSRWSKLAIGEFTDENLQAAQTDIDKAHKAGLARERFDINDLVLRS